MDNNILDNTPNSFLANLSSRLLQPRVNPQQYLQNTGTRNNLADILDGPPSTLDLSEFPSLSGSSTNGNNSLMQGQNVQGTNRPAYVGIIKENAPAPTTSSEFTIHSEDFPALPGSNPSLNISNTHENPSQNSTSGNGLSGLFNSTSINSTSLPNTGNAISNNNQSQNQTSMANVQSNNNINVTIDCLNSSSVNENSNKTLKRGIQTSKDGRVTNIPPGMVTDQFGMVGLLTFIRAAESDPSLVSLALGSDLTTLKLDLNSSESLYSSFPGPWSDILLKPHEIDYSVPQEYLINNQIKDKLASIKLNRYQDDMLFFLFYLFPNDYIQGAAATELYTRDWRYHKDEKVWITRAPGMVPKEKTATYERGTYYYFDAINWGKVAKEFHLDYDRLENRPINMNHANGLLNQQSSTGNNLVGL